MLVEETAERVRQAIAEFMSLREVCLPVKGGGIVRPPRWHVDNKVDLAAFPGGGTSAVLDALTQVVSLADPHSTGFPCATGTWQVPLPMADALNNLA